MLKIVMELKSNTEIVILERNDRPIRTSSLSNFLSGMVNIPEEFQELFLDLLLINKTEI